MAAIKGKSFKSSFKNNFVSETFVPPTALNSTKQTVFSGKVRRKQHCGSFLIAKSGTTPRCCCIRLEFFFNSKKKSRLPLTTFRLVVWNSKRTVKIPLTFHTSFSGAQSFFAFIAFSYSSHDLNQFMKFTDPMVSALKIVKIWTTDWRRDFSRLTRCFQFQIHLFWGPAR